MRIFTGVGLMFKMLADHPDFEKRDLSSLEYAVSAAAMLPPDVAKRWEKVIGKKIVQGYGLTECSPLTHSQLPTVMPAKPESIGIPIFDTDAKVVDPEDERKELPTGEVGELIIRGPQVMKGYWRRPEETKEVLRDGWLHTGDLVKMDEDGYFYYVGREKDIIKYKGYRILPEEIESVLFDHPAVLDSAAVGVPDPAIGETIKAFVVLRSEHKGKVTEGDIIDWAKERMAPYKYPRIVEFLPHIPKTVMGKTDHKALRGR